MKEKRRDESATSDGRKKRFGIWAGELEQVNEDKLSSSSDDNTGRSNGHGKKLLVASRRT